MHLAMLLPPRRLHTVVVLAQTVEIYVNFNVFSGLFLTGLVAHLLCEAQAHAVKVKWASMLLG